MGKVARFLKRTLLALVAIVYGWLTPAHAIGPEFIEDTDSVIEAGVNNQRPVVLVFLAAYRANGPPASTPHDLGSIASNSERYASRIIYVAVVGASTYSAWAIQHAYAGGDPVNRWDPSGLDWEWITDQWVPVVPDPDPFVPKPPPGYEPLHQNGKLKFTRKEWEALSNPRGLDAKDILDNPDKYGNKWKRSTAWVDAKLDALLLTANGDVQLALATAGTIMTEYNRSGTRVWLSGIIGNDASDVAEYLKSGRPFDSSVDPAQMKHEFVKRAFKIEPTGAFDQFKDLDEKKNRAVRDGIMNIVLYEPERLIAGAYGGLIKEWDDARAVPGQAKVADLRGHPEWLATLYNIGINLSSPKPTPANPRQPGVGTNKITAYTPPVGNLKGRTKGRSQVFGLWAKEFADGVLPQLFEARAKEIIDSGKVLPWQQSLVDWHNKRQAGGKP